MKKKVLVVEDDKVNAFIIKKLIADKFDLKIAYTPGEAREALKETDGFFAILMDMDLGNDQIDGSELLQIVRKTEGFSKIPVVATTAYSMKGDRDRFINMGFDEYLAKPIDKHELLKLLDTLCS